ncbi:MAG: FeoB-associated Cys-rich membrane protein [Desulforhopalus sp.]|nr:FeoB-associated Cys-rich membrane protein [Desulforhopalus sp.]
MLENLLVGLVVAVCAFYTGRRLYRQWQVAASRDTANSCAASCCSCCPESSPCDLHQDPPPAAKD